MKIKTKDLLPAVKSLLPIAGRKNTIPVLNCFKIESDGHLLTISASDIDQYCEWKVPCGGKLNACCVNANHLSVLAQSAGESMEITNDLLSLKVVGFGSATLPVLDAEEFIQRPADKAEAVAVNCSELADSIAATDWAVARPNGGRFILEHVFIIITPGKMLVFSTDGRILAKCDKSLIGGNCEVGIHQSRVNAMKDWLGFDGASLLKCDRFVSVKADCGQWFGMLSSDCQTPNYAPTIAGCQMALGSLSKDDFLGCVSTASALGRKNDAGSKPVRLKFGKSSVSIQSDVFHREIDGKFSPYECCFDADYLIPMLNKLSADTLTLKYDHQTMVSWSDGKTDVFLCEIRMAK